VAQSLPKTLESSEPPKEEAETGRGKPMSESQINGVLYQVPTGKPIGIPRRHLAVFGVTRDSGKTTFVEAAVAASGMKAIVFRTKRGEIGFDNAKPLPLFFDERGLTHWKALEGLISATLEEKVHREPGVRYAIISVCKSPTPAKSLAEIHQRVKSKLKDPKLKEFIKEVFTKLDAYLEEVLPQLERLRGSFSDRLELPEPGVYVEDLEGLGVKSDELQNLFVASLIRKAYEELSGIIIVVAEIWKFLPQDRGSPVKWVIEKYVREMGVVQGWLWLDAQDLRGVDKKHLRSFDVRLFGRQPDAHEIDEILKALPLPKQEKPKPEQIMTLKLGHFFAKLKDKVQLVYVRPVWLPESVAIRVAKGELEPDSEEVQQYKPKPSRLLEEDEMVWKEKFEDADRERNRLKGLAEALQMRLEDSEKRIKESDIDGMQKTIADLLEESKRLHEDLEITQQRLKERAEETEQLRKELEGFRELKDALLKIIPVPRVQIPAGAPSPSEISVTTEQPILSVKREHPPLSLTDKDLNGKVAIVYGEGSLGEGWFTVSDVTRAFIKNAWPQDPRVSKVLDEFCQWGFLEKRYSGKRPEYKVRMKPEEAKSKGLLRGEG